MRDRRTRCRTRARIAVKRGGAGVDERDVVSDALPRQHALDALARATRGGRLRAGRGRVRGDAAPLRRAARRAREPSLRPVRASAARPAALDDRRLVPTGRRRLAPAGRSDPVSGPPERRQAAGLPSAAVHGARVPHGPPRRAARRRRCRLARPSADAAATRSGRASRTSRTVQFTPRALSRSTSSAGRGPAA